MSAQLLPRLRKEEGLSVMKRTDLTLDDVDHAGRADRFRPL